MSLESLLRPRWDSFRENREASYQSWRNSYDIWKRSLPLEAKQLVNQLEQLDKEQKPIPNELAVKTALAIRGLGDDYALRYSSFDLVVEGKTILYRLGLGKLLELSPLNLLKSEIGRLYATRCRRCGRILSNPKSVVRGMGPECAKVA